MTLQFSEYHDQIVELLPAYLTGQLDVAQTVQVQGHIAFCRPCQRELAAWEAIRGTTRQAVEAGPFPALEMMDVIWAKIDTPVSHEMPAARFWLTIQRGLRRFGLLFRSQVPLIHKSIWVASALVCLLGLCFMWNYE
jgi:anti-sigma factor RsiW